MSKGSAIEVMQFPLASVTQFGPAIGSLPYVSAHGPCNLGHGPGLGIELIEVVTSNFDHPMT
jgi:hypothetical protein